VNEQLPDLPFRTEGDTKYLSAAQTYDQLRNTEMPEMYCVFPYRIYGAGKADIQIAIDSFCHRAIRDDEVFGWRQESIWSASLGLTEQAKAILVRNVRKRNEDRQVRFDAFWGPNHDWLPDQCHGGNILNTLQLMLLQYDGRKIFLFPAWPREWNAAFKLHAPYETVVEGIYCDGKIKSLNVQPESRRQDVVILLQESSRSESLKPF